MSAMGHLQTPLRLQLMSALPQKADTPGGLISYGVDRAELHRRAAELANKILAGPSHGSSGRAADQLRAGGQPEDGKGTRPHHSRPSILARADDVIE
jgi:hypothetical protein